MQDQGTALREALEKGRAGRKRWCCPEGLRSEVVAYGQARRASGVGIRLIAVEPGGGGRKKACQKVPTPTLGEPFICCLAIGQPRKSGR